MLTYGGICVPEAMVEQRNILLIDVFSFTRFGAEWVNAFWVSELLLFGLYSLGGYLAITLFVSFAGVGTFYLLSRRLTGNNFINAFVLILAAVTAAPIGDLARRSFLFPYRLA